MSDGMASDRAIGATPGFAAYRLIDGDARLTGLCLAPAAFSEGAVNAPYATRSSIERATDLAARSRAEMPVWLEDALGHYLEDFRWLAGTALADAACLAPLVMGKAPADRPGRWHIMAVAADSLFQPVTAPLPPAQVGRVARVLAMALQGYHDRGCLHLDVCPDLMSDRAGSPRLCGLGLPLREWATGPVATNVLVRIETAPPELADISRRSKLGPWTDIFQASATLYWLATGTPPPDYRARAKLDGKGVPQISAALWECGLAKALPELAGAIAAGLALPRTERPQDVATWLQTEWCGSAEPASAPVPKPTPAPKPAPDPAPAAASTPAASAVTDDAPGAETSAAVASTAGKTHAPRAAPSARTAPVQVEPKRRGLIPAFWLAALSGAVFYLGHTYYPWTTSPSAAPVAEPSEVPAIIEDMAAGPMQPEPSALPPSPSPSASVPNPLAPLLGEYSDKQDAGCKRPLRIALPRAGDEAFALEITRQNGDVWKLTEGNGPDAFVQDRIFDASGKLLRPPAKKPQWIIERSGNRLTLTYAGTQFKEEYLLCEAQ